MVKTQNAIFNIHFNSPGKTASRSRQSDNPHPQNGAGKGGSAPGQSLGATKPPPKARCQATNSTIFPSRSPPKPLARHHACRPALTPPWRDNPCEPKGKIIHFGEGYDECKAGQPMNPISSRDRPQTTGTSKTPRDANTVFQLGAHHDVGKRFIAEVLALTEPRPLEWPHTPRTTKDTSRPLGRHPGSSGGGEADREARHQKAPAPDAVGRNPAPHKAPGANAQIDFGAFHGAVALPEEATGRVRPEGRRHGPP